jgi:hypothetical protein
LGGDDRMPAASKVAFTGGLDFNDHHAVWDRLDKHPEIVLLHRSHSSPFVRS